MSVVPAPAIDVEESVRARYAGAARAREESLCCPTVYDSALLSVIPEEVLERDYGCGNPTTHVGKGETVLDLGSGSGKICFLASQVVGPTGKVIGIDMNDEMLSLARRSAPSVAGRVGYANVEFRKGKIQDLALDLESVDQSLRDRPIRSAEDLARFDAELAGLRVTRPLVPEASVDVVISNCVLNLVRPQDKRQLFGEIYRVLRRGGRAVISDIVSDEDVPEHMMRDPELWSGCISGAMREDRFLRAFEDAGFFGIEILELGTDPWHTVEGIEFRSVTLVAYKGKDGPCIDQKHAVIYRGPFREVIDDDGHVLRRGTRTAVCEKTYRIYSGAPYREYFELVPPRVIEPPESAPPFPCSDEALRRDPRETKGVDYSVTTEPAGASCTTNGSCC